MCLDSSNPPDPSNSISTLCHFKSRDAIKLNRVEREVFSILVYKTTGNCPCLRSKQHIPETATTSHGKLWDLSTHVIWKANIAIIWSFNIYFVKDSMDCNPCHILNGWWWLVVSVLIAPIKKSGVLVLYTFMFTLNAFQIIFEIEFLKDLDQWSPTQNVTIYWLTESCFNCANFLLTQWLRFALGRTFKKSQ